MRATHSNIRFIGILLIAKVLSGCFPAPDADSYKENKNNVIVSGASVSVPLGRFVLVRNGNDLCAIRFTGVSSSGTVMNGEYDWYYQKAASDNFVNSATTSGRDKLTSYYTAFTLVRVFGNEHVRCGPFRLWWSFPSYLHFSASTTEEADVGNEIAPTKWKDIAEVAISDSRLKWYSYWGPGRNVSIPIEKLW